MTLQIYLDGEPTAKGRPNFRTVKSKDGRVFGSAYTPKKTRDAENALKRAAIEAREAQGWEFAEKGVNLSVKAYFYMEIPKSWSKKKQKEMEGAYCAKRPDLDNLVKVIDGLDDCGIWDDDSQVVHINAIKRWSVCPGTIIEISRCDD